MCVCVCVCVFVCVRACVCVCVCVVSGGEGEEADGGSAGASRCERVHDPDDGRDDDSDDDSDDGSSRSASLVRSGGGGLGHAGAPPGARGEIGATGRCGREERLSVNLCASEVSWTT